MAQIDIKWTPATDNIGVIEYQIYRKVTGAFDFTLFDTIPFPATAYTLLGLDLGVSYDIKITATDAALNVSDDSNIQTYIAYD